MADIEISDWEVLSEAFREMFDGLGNIEVSDTALRFESVHPDVATGVSLSRDGAMLANCLLYTSDAADE